MFKRSLLAILSFSLITACTTNPYTGERQLSKTAGGAAIGAGVGAGIGAIVGDEDRGRAAAIGAGIGALAGGAVGAYMDAQEARLREQLRGTGVSVTRNGDELILNMPGNVTFATDSSVIRSDFYDVLDSVVLVLKEYRQTVIEVSGHTDSRGSMEYNQALSERRALSVSSYLETEGITYQRILIIGYGETLPIADNSTADGRQLNRRVELRLTPITE